MGINACFLPWSKHRPRRGVVPHEGTLPPLNGRRNRHPEDGLSTRAAAVDLGINGTRTRTKLSRHRLRFVEELAARRKSRRQPGSGRPWRAGEDAPYALYADVVTDERLHSPPLTDRPDERQWVAWHHAMIDPTSSRTQLPAGKWFNDATSRRDGRRLRRTRRSLCATETRTAPYRSCIGTACKKTGATGSWQ
jgi:hypothetical protein